MRTFALWTILFSSAACTAPAYLVDTAANESTSVAEAARELAKADVVVLGEEHLTPAVHELHHELLRAMHEQRRDMVIAMEMFERDVQTVLLQYLNGLVDEQTFLEKSRPWPEYARDYRPVIEFAKANGIVVLAANLPRTLAAKVVKDGAAAVAGERHVARETTAPEDEYWDAFAEVMKAHVGTAGDGAMKRYYESQCLKDDTMAEAIVDHLQAQRKTGARPLTVLVCGHMHSDYRRGTVARIKSRMPDLDVRVVSAEAVKDLAAGVYTVPRSIGDYVVVVQEVHRDPPSAAVIAPPIATTPPATPTTEKPAASPHATAPSTGAVPESTEGLRPALGLMPEYQHQGDGVLVANVRDGGPADKAGIEAGDIIVMLAGEKVTDAQSYSDVLNEQKIGSTITVRVRRETAEVDLQVLVGSRTAR